jgi:hypothetical protein
MNDLPPKLQDWKEGTPQIGAFIRTRTGSVISVVNDAASENQETLILAIAIGGVPSEVIEFLRAWVDSKVKREEI